MMDFSLLTIEDLVQRTGLEESLLRYYESEHGEELPEKILQGGVLYFSPASVAAFGDVHARHQQGRASQRATTSRFARVIAVTSGKGGVGKTNLALNLAIEFQRMGKMTVLFDGDMGLANVHLLAGITPRHSLMDLIRKNVEMAEVIEAGPEGIGIIAGGSGILSMADSSGQDRLRIIESLMQLEKAADIIIVDTGAGMSRGVRDFLMSADEIIFVITPDITSLADAYGLLKGMHQENMGQCPLYLVVNMAGNLKQAADVAQRFAACAKEFLGRTIMNGGYILKDNTVSLATARRIPYSVYRPEARVSKNTRTIAHNLLQGNSANGPGSSSFGRYMNLIRAARDQAPQPQRKTA
ncbi:MAG: AAA family ATPase [Pseudomonadota bacterium]